MRSCSCTSFLRSIVHLQACLLLILSLPAASGAGPPGGRVKSEAATVRHLRSIECKDSATGMEFAPLGICLDAVGDLYVVDSDNSRIYKADGETDALTLFSECPAEWPDCEFIDLAGSAAGGVYVSERTGGAVLELDRWGELGAFVEAGEGVAGIGEAKAGRVFAAMSVYGSIRMVDFEARAGMLETVITHEDVNAYPVDCQVLGDGTVIVTDSFSKQVLFLSGLGRAGDVARGFDFESPFGVTCMDERLVLVTDSEHALVAVFDRAGDFLYSFGEGILDTPTFLDSTEDGLVFVSDAESMTIEVFEIEETPTK